MKVKDFNNIISNLKFNKTCEFKTFHKKTENQKIYFITLLNSKGYYGAFKMTVIAFNYYQTFYFNKSNLINYFKELKILPKLEVVKDKEDK